jgi:hypothetical protein
MTGLLLVTLLLLDLALLAAVVFLNRRQEVQKELILELTEERRILTELRDSVRDELELGRRNASQILEKVTHVAAEAEMEVKSGGATIAEQMEGVVKALTSKFDQPLKDLHEKQVYIEGLISRLASEKSAMAHLVKRGEYLTKFFNKNVPLDELIEDMEDKKYTDARRMIAIGHSPTKVASDLGLTVSEVKMVAGLVGR